MCIGIGCTSYNRPECLAKWKEQISKHTNMDNVLIYIAIDTDQDRQGVAKRKNECLRALKDCDHIFLFDDDCWPIADGWVEFCLSEGSEHLLLMHTTFHRKISDRAFMDCGGVFMYMTGEAVRRVGAFNEEYKLWGFEHAEYSNRITGVRDSYPTNINLNKYIYSEDYSNPAHKSSITDLEKQKCFSENLPKFREPIKNIYLPL